jgi:hypothetical protein
MTGRKLVTVAGVFQKAADAERAVHELRRAGFRGGQVRVLGGAHGTGTGRPAATETAVPGGVVGGVVGAVAVVTGAIPVVGPVLATGLVAGVAGTAVGAAAGGIMGVADTPAYAAHLDAGRTVVTVRAVTRHREAAAVLSRCGAEVV